VRARQTASSVADLVGLGVAGTQQQPLAEQLLQALEREVDEAGDATSVRRSAARPIAAPTPASTERMFSAVPIATTSDSCCGRPLRKPRVSRPVSSEKEATAPVA